jgi:hypothetical protein
MHDYGGNWAEWASCVGHYTVGHVLVGRRATLMAQETAFLEATLAGLLPGARGRRGKRRL